MNLGRYEGILIRQGVLSQQIGFAVGELCWTATPTPNSVVMRTEEEWRWGSNGVSTRAQWQSGILPLNRITSSQFVTTSTTFRRIGDGPSPVQGTTDREPPVNQARTQLVIPNSGSPPLNSSGGGNQNWGAGPLLHGPARKLQPDYLNEMPSVEAVGRKVRDRQASKDRNTRYIQGARGESLDRFIFFRELAVVVRTLPGGTTGDARAVIKEYENAQKDAATEVGPIIPSEDILESPSEFWKSLRQDLLEMVPLNVRAQFVAKRQADIADAKAAADKKQAAYETAREALQVEAKQAAEKEKAASDADQEIRRLALVDGLRAKGHINMEVFGVPLGSALDLPDCSIAGHSEQRLFGKVMVSAKTCVLHQVGAPTSILWGENVLPEWAQYSLTTEVKGDVLVSIKIVIPSWPRHPTRTINGGLVDAIVDGSMQKGYENEQRNAPARVAKAQKQLKAKYGQPTHTTIEPFTLNGVVVRKTDEPEWILPGLHVKYDADVYEDTVLIELDSVFKARVDRSPAEPTL
jgi:hypothetical protein